MSTALRVTISERRSETRWRLLLLLSVIRAHEQRVCCLLEMLPDTDGRGLRRLLPPTSLRSHLPLQRDWRLYYWTGCSLSVTQRQHRHELTSLLRSFLQTVRDTRSERSGKPGTYSKYTVIYEHRRASIYVGVTYHRTGSYIAPINMRIFFPITISYAVLYGTTGTASVEHVTLHET